MAEIENKFVKNHIVQCPKCGGDALDHMVKCPKCGGALTPKGYREPNPYIKRNIKVISTIFFAVIAIAIVVYILLK